MSEVPVTLNGPGGQQFTGSITLPDQNNPFNPAPGQGSQAIIPYQGGMTPVRLPNGQVINVATQDVPALQAAYQAQQQQQQVVNLGGGKTGPGGVLRAGADAAQVINGIMTRANIADRKAEIVNVIARMNKALYRIGGPSGVPQGPPNGPGQDVFNALVAQRDAMITIFTHMDGLYSAALIQALGGGAALADDFGLFQGPGMGGAGAGLGIAVGLGGGLLLANLSAPTAQVDLTTIGINNS